MQSIQVLLIFAGLVGVSVSSMGPIPDNCVYKVGKYTFDLSHLDSSDYTSDATYSYGSSGTTETVYFNPCGSVIEPNMCFGSPSVIDCQAGTGCSDPCMSAECCFNQGQSNNMSASVENCNLVLTFYGGVGNGVKCSTGDGTYTSRFVFVCDSSETGQGYISYDNFNVNDCVYSYYYHTSAVCGKTPGCLTILDIGLISGGAVLFCCCIVGVVIGIFCWRRKHHHHHHHYGYAPQY